MLCLLNLWDLSYKAIKDQALVIEESFKEFYVAGRDDSVLTTILARFAHSNNGTSIA